MSDAAPTPEQISAARAHRLLPADQFNLNMACAPIVEAYGWHVFHVGSSLRSLTGGGPWRDIDVRCMLADDEFDRMFPAAWPSPHGDPHGPRLALMNVAMSEWLSARTGLPCDFQFQRGSQANEKYPGPEHQRSALGIFHRKIEEAGAPAP